MKSLVSTLWLAEQLGDPQLVVVDASMFMAASGRNAYEEYARAHIKGARFLDIEALSDHSNPSPHMLPPALDFARAMKNLGINREDRIIVYDNSPLRSAARGWFMFRHFGAPSVAILDGGLQKWIAEGLETTRAEPLWRDATFEPLERDEIATKAQLLAGTDLPWLDARSKPRFDGREPDPRPGVAAGHAPGQFNLPFGALYRDDGTFRPANELEALFKEAGIDPFRPFVASCGSGVTANSLIFAAHLLGNDGAKLYDGSWSEWGGDPSTPKVTGLD